MASTEPNPIARLLQGQPVLVLDGGLATALEARGCDLNHELWSAKVLLENPELIRRVHLDFLAAGADCIMTCSYQATLEGFRRQGLSEAAGEELLKLSVRLAVEARDAFWEKEENREGRQRPLVAASIGPYGAFLADGSEYTGGYGISSSELKEFHRGRWRILAQSDVDLMACETIPAAEEARLLLELLRETPDRWALVSFSCRDAKHLSDGGGLREAVALCDGEAQVAAIGVNCVPPELVPALIDEVRRGTGKPVVVYPNSGEIYDPGPKEWHSPPASISWEKAPTEWVRRGSAGVGGCCRVTPEQIEGIRRALLG